MTMDACKHYMNSSYLVQPMLFCIFFLAFATLMCGAQAQGFTVNKQELSSVGLSIVLPDDPAYDAELHGLGFTGIPDAAAVRPHAAILKNSSKRSVVAFAVNWTIADMEGNTTSRGLSYLQPSGLLDGGRAKREQALVEHQIRPGASRLITANGMPRNADELHALAEHPFLGSVTDVQLDLAIFDDGEAVGPNTLGLMEHVAAYVNAEQDLMQEVDARVSKGEPLRQVLTDIRGRVGAETGETPTTPAALYDRNFKMYLKELEATADYSGEEGARNVIAYRKYSVRPNIHRPSTEKGGR
jgi:hypothetical protein